MKVEVTYKYGCKFCGDKNIRPDEDFCSDGSLIYICDACGNSYGYDIRKWTKRKLANKILSLFFWDHRENPPIFKVIEHK